ncbi:MAG TPA: serine/threonine-protein kinase [bacterium]|nr:serine/threonine-protein kinase [bacterium]HPP29654.1 serine/threonine-protein kinase [bacterium]
MRERAEYVVKLTGDVFNGYTVEEKIWQGATSTVYRCRGSGRYGNIVAIKVLHPYRNHPSQIQQFIREAKIQASLRHKNIVEVYGVGRKDHLVAIFMEYVNGISLRVASQTVDIPAGTFIKFFIDLADTVDYIHKRGIIHNDIKPENIIIGKSLNILKLTDFGYAEKLHRWFGRKNGYSGGTEGYMAPERAKGLSDKRSDIYSIGVLLDEFLKDKLEGREEIYSIIVKATQRDPFKRYASAAELKFDLETLYLDYQENFS